MSEQPSSAHWQLQSIVTGLRGAREQWRTRNGRSIGEQGGRELPSREAMRQILEQLCGALFPMRLGPVDLREESEDFYVGHTLDAALTALLTQARLELRYAARQSKAELASVDSQALKLIQGFAAALPELRVLLDTDVLAAYHGDPAARSVDEVLLCYPGILAIIHHRLAHHLYQAGLPLLARIEPSWRIRPPVSTSTLARRSARVSSSTMAPVWSSAKPRSSASACASTRR
ncbi:hypothetical protein GLGCALEP_00269 [Pseudomonas sp. MM221]|nr:hypothetical protein DBADOPDK_00265 [Pseudomonas sp. MM223]CAI3791807.1 hypothetical protein GLGCALEP_00269 [Pseudomonas sp. MM221]